MSTILKNRHYSCASTYDMDARAYRWCAPEVLIRRLLSTLQVDNLLRVIDIAVGTGEASKVFLEMGHQVIGLDISNNMLQEAKKKYPTFYQLKYYDINKPLATADITKESADVIICCGAMHYVTNLDLTLADIASCLIKNGHLAFTYIPKQKLTFAKETRSFDTEVVKQTVSQLGLSIINQEQFIAYYQIHTKNEPVFYELIIEKKKL